MQLTMPSKQTVKNLVKIVVGFTSARVVKTVIYNNIDSDLTKAQKAQVWIGSGAVAMTVSDACERHIDKLVDELYKSGSEIKDQSNTVQSTTVQS